MPFGLLDDLTEDMAAEQKARAAYERILDLTCDEDVIAPIRFLREREIVHFQRFGECLETVQRVFASGPSRKREMCERMLEKNPYGNTSEYFYKQC